MYLLARKSFMNWFNRSAFWRLEGSVDQAAHPETRMDLGTLDDRSPVVAEVRVCRRDWPNRLQVSAIIEALQGIARNRIRSCRHVTGRPELAVPPWCSGPNISAVEVSVLRRLAPVRLPSVSVATLRSWITRNSSLSSLGSKPLVITAASVASGMTQSPNSPA
jgi:hypothetical protein